MYHEDTAGAVDKLATAIELELTHAYGPTLHGQALATVLGYASAAALRQAAKMGRVGVALFTPENRRGRWAVTREVAHWLAVQRFKNACNPKPPKTKAETMT